MHSSERIGQVLVNRGVVDPAMLERARSFGAASELALLAHLLEGEGKTEAELASALAEELGIPGVDLSRTVFDLASLDLVPRTVAEADLLLSLSTEGGRLHLAVSATAASHPALDEAQFVTGMLVSPYAALPEALAETIAAAYDARDRGEKIFRGKDAATDQAPGMAVLVPEPIEGEPLAPQLPAEAISDLEPVELQPLALEVDAGAATEEEEEVVVGPPRVLVVDDEPEILKLVATALTKSGFAVETASDGREAEQKLQGPPPELVLLDAMLPHVHGFEICSRIKGNERLRGVPVIMMSAVYRGWRFAEDTRESYGADDYLEKPFHLNDLLRRVHERLANPPKPLAEEERAEAERQYQEGVRLLEAEKLEEARAALERSLAKDPFSAKAHFALALALQGQGEIFRAINSYEKALELRPNQFRALRSLAELYLEKGFRRKAAEALERALQAAPDPEAREAIRTKLLRLL